MDLKLNFYILMRLYDCINLNEVKNCLSIDMYYFNIRHCYYMILKNN
jgi:hypothetical protein